MRLEGMTATSTRHDQVDIGFDTLRKVESC